MAKKQVAVMVNEKVFPKVGDHLYLSQRTGSYYIDAVKSPYTVIAVTTSTVVVQAAKPVFYGVRYYDTLADDIIEDKSGEVKVLHWGRKSGKWQHKYGAGDRYPEYAYFGNWEFYPYLD